MTSPTVRLTYLGGPSVLIEVGALRFLNDPTFEPAGYSYARGSQEFRKTQAPAIAAEALGLVDAVLLSHDQHLDNLDPAGRAYLATARMTLTTPEGAARLGGAARGVGEGETTVVQAADGFSVRVTATPAHHGPEQVLPLSGHVTGWLLEWDGQRNGALYISGDTVLYPGVEAFARSQRIGVALLHCGAARAEGFGPYDITFSGAEAAQMARLLGDATILPIHYEGWSHFTEGRSAIELAFAAHGLTQRLRFLPYGVAVEIEL